MLTKTLLTSLLTNSTSKSALAVTVTRSLSSGNKANTLIIGAPGSGKGTISNWIVRDFGLLHVSSGDLLRAQMREGTELGLAAKSFIGETEARYRLTVINFNSRQGKSGAGQRNGGTNFLRVEKTWRKALAS